MKNVPSFKNEDSAEHHRKVTEGIENAVTLGYDKLKENHLTDYQPIFNRISLSLGGDIKNDVPTDELRQTYKNTGNKMLDELFFQYGRYMLIASSREGSMPANLQGVWNSSNTPSWGSGYTVNVNLEMNYWPATAANMKETMQPLIDFYTMLSGEETGQKTARHYYGIDNGGWVHHSGVNLFGYTGVGKEIRYALTPASSAWICQNLWDFYAYTMDGEILEEIYPIIKGNTLFFKEQLVKDNNGKYQTGPSISSEQGPMTLGTKYDMQLVYELFTNFLEAAELVGETDSALIEDVKNKRADMDMPWEIGECQDGQLMEWDIDMDDKMYNSDDPHRYISHLMALYPTSQINPNTPELMDAAKRTLNLRGDLATGWSRAMKTLLWARAIGDDGSGTNTTNADHAYRIFQGQLTDYVYDNLFDAHAPFQADGNYGATAALCEFLVQSGGGEIDILPSVPTAWQNKGAVKGLSARGGFTVDIAWENSRANEIEVASGAGGECVLNYPFFTSETAVMCGDEEIETSRNGSSIAFETEKGKSYTVTVGNGNIADYEISDIVFENGDTPVPVNEISANGEIKEVIVTKHIESDNNSGTLYVAVYDENGALKAVKSVDADMSDYLLNTSRAVEVNMPLPSDAASTWQVKAFLWDSQMKPLANAYVK